MMEFFGTKVDAGPFELAVARATYAKRRVNFRKLKDAMFIFDNYTNAQGGGGRRRNCQCILLYCF